jgi:hypothetical protein
LPRLGGDHSATPVLPWRKGSVTELLGDAQQAFCWSMAKDGDPDRERTFAHLERVILYLQG